jgi:hypothetical protein
MMIDGSGVRIHPTFPTIFLSNKIYFITLYPNQKITNHVYILRKKTETSNQERAFS